MSQSAIARADAAAAIIRTRLPDFKPALGILLGSGLGGFADRLQASVAIPYADLPGFPVPTVSGHAGRLLLGHADGVPLVVLQGRAHYYEDGRADAMRLPIDTLGRLGCPALLLTCAAGSLHSEFSSGSILTVNDHVNFAGVSPLIGAGGAARFIDMCEAYDPGLRQSLHQAAKTASIRLHEGVYGWFAGPQFETPAEIRAARQLGVDAVGMSIVPEVILARHAGLKVAALAIITNLGAGLAPGALDHRQTLENAGRASADLIRLLEAFLSEYRQAWLS
jgi:purine-nucleoside phosphorylase